MTFNDFLRKDSAAVLGILDDIGYFKVYDVNDTFRYPFFEIYLREFSKRDWLPPRPPFISSFLGSRIIP